MVAGNDDKRMADTSGSSASASLLMNGQTARLKPTKEKRKRKGICRLGNLFRIAFWYFIFTSFYCPSAVDFPTKNSPKPCRVYYQVTNHIFPIIQPYIETYATPYLEPVRPHYVTVQKRLIKPAIKFGRQHGRPIFSKVLLLVKSYWLRFAQPQIQKYCEITYQLYRQSLGPHVDEANKTIRPYIDKVKTNMLTVYSEITLSQYNSLKPLIINGYILAHEVATNTVYPWLKWIITNGEFFFIRTVRPRLKLLYGENVEPQLIKIGKRLGRYRDARKIKFTGSEIKSTSRNLEIQTTSLASPQSPDYTPVSPSMRHSDSGISGDNTGSDLSIREKAQIMVTRDLKEWQQKYSNAADEAADELEIHVMEITDKFISDQVKTAGSALLKELEEDVNNNLEKLKNSISSMILESNDPINTTEAISIIVRKTGISVKEKVQLLLEWRQNQNQRLMEHVRHVVLETFEVLDTIQNIGLQEVAMRWAWTDGVTYKQWAKFHAMKAKFSEWREEVEQVATKHPGLKKAHVKMSEIEMAALTIADNAARDLASLKEIGLWKLLAKDTSDNFDTTILPAATADKSQEKLGEVSSIEDNTSSLLNQNLGLVTTSTKISEVLSSTSNLPRAEEIVIVAPTSHSDTRVASHFNQDFDVWDPTLDSKYISHFTFGKSEVESLSNSKIEGQKISERSNKARASPEKTSLAGPSTALEANSPLGSTEISAESSTA